MRIRKQHFIFLVIILAWVLLTACSISSLTNQVFSREPSPSMTGTWQDPDLEDTFLIKWENGRYVVLSAYWISDMFTIVDQDWSNGTLEWTYFDSVLEEMVTYETIAVTEDTLIVKRTSSYEYTFELERIK